MSNLFAFSQIHGLVTQARDCHIFASRTWPISWQLALGSVHPPALGFTDGLHRDILEPWQGWRGTTDRPLVQRLHPGRSKRVGLGVFIRQRMPDRICLRGTWGGSVLSPAKARTSWHALILNTIWRRKFPFSTGILDPPSTWIVGRKGFSWQSSHTSFLPFKQAYFQGILSLLQEFTNDYKKGTTIPKSGNFPASLLTEQPYRHLAWILRFKGLCHHQLFEKCQLLSQEPGGPRCSRYLLSPTNSGVYDSQCPISGPSFFIG